MKRLLFITLTILSVISTSAQKEKVIKIQVTPQEASIYVDNVLMGNGYAEFTRPQKKNQVAIIRIECNEYITMHSKFYGRDERNSLSFKLNQDGFYRASACLLYTSDAADEL